jgi:hypothetical protein
MPCVPGPWFCRANKKDPLPPNRLIRTAIRLINPIAPQISLDVSPNPSDPCDDRNPVKEKVNERKRNR